MIVFGAYTAYLTDTFFVEQDKPYDLDDPIIGPIVSDIRDRFPKAFKGNPEPATGPAPVIEQATAAPGETRPSRATGSTKKRG